ncbi:MAG: nuclear transport factor 2 family protein [Ilumatobacteraceae bacterium]
MDRDAETATDIDPAVVATLVAERSCERLMYTYAQLVDFGGAAGIADLFTTDGVWLGADGGAMRGQAAIREAFSRRQGLTRRQSRHVITNVLVDVRSPDEAEGIAYLINYRHDSQSGVAEHPAPADAPKFVGEYHLSFRKDAAGWRIATLRFDLAFLRSRRT